MLFYTFSNGFLYLFSWVSWIYNFFYKPPSFARDVAIDSFRWLIILFWLLYTILSFLSENWIILLMIVNICCITYSNAKSYY